jgi:hypothetical protein
MVTQRMGRTARAWGAFLAGLVALGGLTAEAGAAPANAARRTAHAASAGIITATWTGSLTWDEVYDPSRPAILQNGASLTWSYSITVRATPSGGTVVGTPSLTIGGSTYATAAPPNQRIDCTGTLSHRASGKPNQFGPVGIVYESGLWNLDWFAPYTGEWVQSTGVPNSDCATVPNGGAPSPPCGPAISPSIELRPQELPWSHTYSLSGTGRYPKGGVDCWVTGSATISFTGTGAGAPPLPPMPGRYRAKALATLALQATYQDALYPCLATGASIPLFALGPPGQIAALTIGAVGAPLCLAYLKTINDLAQIIKDPPLRSYDVIAKPEPVHAAAAKPPSCTGYSGATATFCGQFEAAAQKLLAAAQHVRSVAGAMRTTISRESGALAAHNYSAVRKQDKALAGLDRKFSSDEAAQTAAGARVAALMNGAGLPATLTSSQVASAVTAVTKGLGKAGLSAKKLHSLLGTPAIGPYDWLIALVS